MDLTCEKTDSPSHRSIVEQTRRLAIKKARQLLQLVPRARVDAGDFQVLARFMNALPLSQGDYCQAINHLENAQKYWYHREPGASCYELRLLAQLLSRPRTRADKERSDRLSRILTEQGG